MSEEQKEKVIEFYQRTAETYDKEYEIPYYKEVYDKITWHYIEPYLPEKGIVLDAGGGTGRWAIPIAKKGLKVVIFDISKEMLQVAQRKISQSGLNGLVTTRLGDIRDVDFPDNYFDFVLAEGDPISYCGDPEKAVQELARVAKPESYISAGVDSTYPIARRMINSPNVNLDEVARFLQERVFCSSRWGFHCWSFTPDDLRNLFMKYGLKVVKLVGKPVLFLGRSESNFIFQDPEKTRKLLDIELSLCETSSIVGFGGHLHIVGKKA